MQWAYESPTATLSEVVLFEYSDASGMSYRTVDKDGAAAATGDGGEGSPIETDPLGGSVGLLTPYLSLYQYEPQLPILIPFGNAGPDIPGQDFASLYSFFGSRMADLPGFGTNWGSFVDVEMAQLDEMSWNSIRGLGRNTNEQLNSIFAQLGLDIYVRPGDRITGFGHSSTDGFRIGGDLTFEQALQGAEGQIDLVFANSDGEGLTDDDEVSQFFRESARCFNVLQKKLGDRFDSFLNSLNKMKYVDVRRYPSLLEKSLTDLQIPNIAEGGVLSPAAGTLGSLEVGANAVTSPNTNTAYLYSSFFDYSVVERGGVKVHEQLHSFLRGNHLDILGALDLSVPEREMISRGTPEYRNPQTGFTLSGTPTIFETADQAAGRKLKGWLSGGCK